MQWQDGHHGIYIYIRHQNNLRCPAQSNKAITGYEDRAVKISFKTYIKLPTLRFRRLRSNVIEVYKMLPGIYTKSAYRRMFSIDQLLKIDKQRASTNLKQNTLILRVVNAWNSLHDYDVLDKDKLWSPNDTAYKRWSCHSGCKLLCKLCRNLPPPEMGARFTGFGQSGPMDDWRCSS